LWWQLMVNTALKVALERLKTEKKAPEAPPYPKR
jgi:hypothetical protein